MCRTGRDSGGTPSYARARVRACARVLGGQVCQPESSHFGSVSPDADAPVPGSQGQRITLRRQSVRVSLARLTIAELGEFLAAWTQAQKLWSPTRIELIHVRQEVDPGDRGDRGDPGGSGGIRGVRCMTFSFSSPQPMSRTNHEIPLPRTPYIQSLNSLLLGLFALIGCATKPYGPYTPLDIARKDTAKAQRLSQDAAAVLDAEPDRAERLLREALTADIDYGPAHNNLGVLFLSQGKLFAAANEFEWARKLMPGHPDPRMNLAFTLERAGRIDDALATYATALEVYPNHLQTIQALARLQLRYDRDNDQTDDLLSEIALRGETDQWRTWARTQLLAREE